MQTITEVDATDLALNTMCGDVAKDIFAKAGSGADTRDRDMLELVFCAATITAQRLARIGKQGVWCFFCGADSGLSVCTCQFPSDFRCHGRLVDEPCRKSHFVLGNYIERMCRFPVVERADSRRSQYEMRLYRAASHVCNPNDSDDYDHTEQRDLAFHLAQADPFGDGEVFRAGVLRAFRVSKFLLYQSLTAELERLQGEAIHRAIQRTLRQQTGTKQRSRKFTTSEIPGAEFYR